jgi:hypothetical protein
VVAGDGGEEDRRGSLQEGTWLSGAADAWRSQ